MIGTAFALWALAWGAAGAQHSLQDDAQDVAKLFSGMQVARAETSKHGIGHVLLSEREYEYGEGLGQQGAGDQSEKPGPPMPSHPVYIEFFAVPPQDRRKIERFPWGEDHRPYYHTEKIHLGVWRGRRWYGDLGLYHQSYLRKKLGFVGGQDRLALLIRGLGVKDRGSLTANSCQGLLAQEGPSAIPYLQRATALKDQQITWKALSALGKIQDPRATRILLDCYESSNDDIRQGAAYGLIHRPYRKYAKSAYLEMLNRSGYAVHGAEAALEFGWKDALPKIAKAMASARYLYAYGQLFDCYRALSGNPIDPQLKETEKQVRSWASQNNKSPLTYDEAKKTLLASQDIEAVTIISLSLIQYVTKGDTRDSNALGQEVLAALPRRSAIAVLSKIKNSLQNEQDRAAVLHILATWGA